MLFLAINIATCQSSYKPKKQVRGIVIPEDLYQFSKAENYYLVKYIEGVLDKKTNALMQLINFDCGGASFCYDLGGVILQTLDKIGEASMIRLTEKFDKKAKNKLKLFLLLGLEYSDVNSSKRKAPGKPNLSVEFPKLDKRLSQ